MQITHNKFGQLKLKYHYVYCSQKQKKGEEIITSRFLRIRYLVSSLKAEIVFSSEEILLVFSLHLEHVIGVLDSGVLMRLLSFVLEPFCSCTKFYKKLFVLHVNNNQMIMMKIRYLLNSGPLFQIVHDLKK